MASKTHLLIFLSIAIMATSIADAQILNVTLSLSGIINCTVNSSVVGAPAFPNAAVLLQCPPGINITTTTTSSSGAFNISLNVFPALPALLPVITNCRIFVATPLVRCNASLPTVGRLVAPINIVGLGLTLGNRNLVIRANVLGINLNLDTGIGK